MMGTRAYANPDLPQPRRQQIHSLKTVLFSAPQDKDQQETHLHVQPAKEATASVLLAKS